MREIKLRAWDTVRKEYLSGGEFLLAIQPGKRPKAPITYLDILNSPDRYKNRFVIEQFVDLNDKNGLEIYDGDNIRWVNWNGETCESIVRFDPEWNRFCVWLNGAQSIGVNRHLSNDIEVIGNIHSGTKLFKETING